MAHSRSALKRWRQNEKRRARNKPVRTATRSAVKRVRTAAAEGGETEAALREAQSILDKAAKRRVIHPNTAARHKSRMQKAINAAAGTEPEPKKRATKKTAAKKTATKRAAKKS